MDTKTLHTIIAHIDEQLSKISLSDSNKSAADHLFNLRNDLILQYRPDPAHDWTFKNKRLLKFFGKEVNWVIP